MSKHAVSANPLVDQNTNGGPDIELHRLMAGTKSICDSVHILSVVELASYDLMERRKADLSETTK